MRLLVSLEPVGENGLLEIVLIAVEIAGGVDDPVVVEEAEEVADGVDGPVVVDAVATADLDTKKRSTTQRPRVRSRPFYGHIGGFPPLRTERREVILRSPRRRGFAFLLITHGQSGPK